MDLIELKTKLDNEMIQSELNALKINVDENKILLIKSFEQNQEYASEINDLIKTESEKQIIVKKNQEIIADLKTKLNETQNKYYALITQKDIQYEETSKELTQTALQNNSLAVTMMKLFGMKLKLHHIENDVWEIKFIFSNEQEINVHFNIFDSKFSLQSMIPMFSRFEDLKQFLHRTQDISGLLYTARNFFSN